jgi:prolyl-tRNA synthetase
MKRTQLFTKTSKTAPSDETAQNAQLLIRAGYVHKEMAGVYAYLPLGLKTLENIKQIVREEMNAIGGQELLMTNLQPREPWEKTGRWDDETVDIWFKTRLKNDEEIGLAWSHEEAIMEMASQFIHSYKDLENPLTDDTRGVSVYQFQTKLRNELRAKAGIMRGREFLMKDMYSLHANKADCDKYYEKVAAAYDKIFARLGIGELTFRTFASGGAFTKYSDEYQTVCDAGEDWLYLDREKNLAVNEEVLNDATKDLGLNRAKLEKVRSAEVGNIFNFGAEKGETMKVFYTASDGTQKPVFLASYGIGPSRVMGVLAEIFADDRGLVWPENVAPFRVYLINVGTDENVVKITTNLYDELREKGVEVLWDDRDVRPGEKFADADLLGIPHRVVISPKTVEQNAVEYKARTSDEAAILPTAELFKKLTCI